AQARRSAARLLAEQDADLINVYQPLSGYGVLASSLGRRLPSLYSFLSPAPLEYRSRQRMTAHHRAGVTGVVGLAALWMAEGARLRPRPRIHVMSDFSVSLLWRLYRIPAERTVKIPGGVDVERFQPAADRRQVRAGLGRRVDAPLLLTVRTLEARRGLDTLIAAMVGLVRRSPELRLLIGGAGSHRDTLERQGGRVGRGKQRNFFRRVPLRRSRAVLPGGRRLRPADSRARRLRAGDRGGAGLRHTGARHADRCDPGAARVARPRAGLHRRPPRRD